jgi:hypothetical protein
MMSTPIRLILLILSTGTIAFCIWRDIQLEKQYTGDLRNRIVGARLQKNGRLPYFYKWDPTDGLRYYDPQNFDTLKVSNITATPFLHQMLYPLAESSQRSISRIWLVIEYGLLLISLTLAYSFARKRNQRWAITAITLLFLFTSAWKGHIAAGQYYIVIPALFMLFYYFISRKKFLAHAVIAGILAAVTLLVRPNALLFFLPFLFLWSHHPKRYRIAFVITIIAFLSLTLINQDNRLRWNNFRLAMKEQLKAHQGQPTVQKNMPDPGFDQWEGWNKKQIIQDAEAYPVHFESEHGNLFLILRHLLSLRLPPWLISAGVFLLVLFLSFIFYKRNAKSHKPSLFAIAIFGSCLYMISDLCSPFYRFQYNTTQWLFPLLLTAACYQKRYIKIYVLLIAGLLLNIIEIPAIPFEHTAGEYLILAGLLLLCFTHSYLPSAETKNHT